MTIEFLLRRFVATGDARPLAIARRSLDAMADGGVRDQLGGGFHRYSTDAEWLVPHFEQMLYDNAQLARVYVHAWALTGDARYRAVGEATLDYMIRELTTSDGAFAASQDADTEGEEGLTFVWTADEIGEVLGDDAPFFAGHYEVTPLGNWEGRTILRRTSPPADAAVEARLAAARGRLLERRSRRPQPARDDKALAAWNGLAIAAFADAGRLLGDERYVAAAARAAEAIVVDCRRRRAARPVVEGGPGGRARRARGLNAPRRRPARALRGDVRRALDHDPRALMDRVLARFEDPAGGFFDTADDHERLVTRPKDLQDNATPSGNAVAALVLLRLAASTGEGRCRTSAERAIRTVAPFAERTAAFAQWLSAIDFALSDAVEVAIVATRGRCHPAMLEPVATGYRRTRCRRGR